VYNPETGEGNGFTFADINVHDMLFVVHEAVELYRTDRKAWKKLQRSAMTTDFSWDKSAGEYLDIYSALAGR
jgi:starch synthase